MRQLDRFRLLLVAPHCDATDVGEAWSTFQWVKGLSAIHDVTLLTYQRRGRPPASAQLPGMRVVEWKDWPVPRRFERLNSGVKPAYVPFYFKARRWIRHAIGRGERFDIAHQLSPLALRYPSPAAGLVRPFVMGPVGGSLETPAAFCSECGTDPWYVRLRAMDRWRFRVDPLLRRTFESADLVLGVAPYVRELLGDRLREFAVLSETGIVALPAMPERGRERGRLRLLYAGRIVRTKGVRDAVRTMGHLRDLPRVMLDVVGDGPDRAACEREAQSLGVAERVRFHGRVPRAELDEFYRRAEAFLFPSFREPSGNVVFESMGWGLPVIAADRGGPGYVIDASCGILARPTEPQVFAIDLAAAVRTLAMDPARADELGLGARRRVAAVALWERKIASVDETYRRLAADRAENRVRSPAIDTTPALTVMGACGS
jgi:glycosyltransferase involved in cell wall biosynthesis